MALLKDLGRGLRNLTRDNVGQFFGMESNADLAAKRMQEALGQSRTQMNQAYQDVYPMYEPYAQMGMEQTQALPGLAQEIESQNYDVQGYRAPGLFKFKMNDYMNSPAYRMQQQAGEEAINRASAARGLFASTPTMQNLSRFNQDLASQGYGQEYGRQMSAFQTNRDAYQNYINTLRAMNQERYGRQADRYSRAENLAAQNRAFTQALANARLGQGTALSDIAIQSGNVSAQQRMANAETMNNLLQQLIKAAPTAFSGGAPVPGM